MLAKFVVSWRERRAALVGRPASFSHPMNPRVSLSLNPSGDRVGKPARLQPRKFAVVAQRRKRAVDRLDASGLEVVKRSRDTVIGIVLDAGNRAFGQQTFGDEVRRVAGLNTGGQAMQVAQ